MCQYTTRCETGEHRPDTKCPVTGQQGRSWTPRSTTGGFTQSPRPVAMPVTRPPFLPASIRSRNSEFTLPPRDTSREPRVVTPSPTARTTNDPIIGGSRYGRARGTGALSVVDLVIALIVATSWDRFYDWAGWWGVAGIVALTVVPFILAGWLSRHCTAWNTTVDGRCARLRPKPFQRCESHGHGHDMQLITAHEMAALVCFISGVGMVWALLFLR